jgi:uncharacterized protein (TIGR00369 family)
VPVEKVVAIAEMTALLNESRFHQLLQLELVEQSDAHEGILMRLPMSAQVERAPATGQFHGGPIASLIDVAGDFALVRALGHGVPTITLNVEYLRPAVGAWLLAKATVRRAGRTVGFVDIEVTDPQQRLVALGRGCYSTQPG